MLDLFAIFGKGGIVLWCINEAHGLLESSVNSLIREVMLQQRTSAGQYQKDGQILKFKLDNEFELVFIAVYQSIVQLSYVDKLLAQVQAEFRERYKDSLVLAKKTTLVGGCASLPQLVSDGQFKKFGRVFEEIRRTVEEEHRQAPVKKMKAYEESAKAQKTVASMIISGKENRDTKAAKPKKPAKSEKAPVSSEPIDDEPPPQLVEGKTTNQSPAEEDEFTRKRDEFFKKQMALKSPQLKATKKKTEPKPKGKQARQWDLSGKPEDAAVLDFSSPAPTQNGEEPLKDDIYTTQKQFVGTMSGELAGLDVSDDEEIELKSTKTVAEPKAKGWFSAFSNLVGSQKLTKADVQPALEKMRDALIEKNVASTIAEKLCDSVASELEGRVLGTFDRIHSTVKETVRKSLTQILSPRRRVDILRDVIEAKRQKRPYVITFCGVNGVGKSTNLAKITFWLSENGHRILIAAGDTFRAGAVEQLRTHVRRLNALHPDSVTLYEQGYGKDPAAIAQHAIANARDTGFDVVLVDTAGRMQDNEPLMRALTKLIKLNQPDLVLFVGEALVGNEAVDQLVKFNQALADHSDTVNADGSKAQPRLIDGILLTKFDTIDDKVGAAISMTYITGQPIVFVGTGQTYKDLRNLNVDAVVHALLK